VIATLTAMPGEPAARRLAMLIDVLVRLAERWRGAEVLASAGYAPALNEESRGRIEHVCRHIHEHLSDPLEQGDLAAMVSMNAAAFSRFFKRATGRTLTAYVNELRVARACRLLTDSRLSVLDVCYRSGYNNVANFNRRFREIKGVTPSEYRRAMTQ
jgi:transcriptional regulator GlxA family with amidase domain